MTSGTRSAHAPRRRGGSLPRRLRLASLALAVGLLGASDGPYDIALFATPKAPDARGSARLVFAPSPFGVTVTADGRASYDVQVTAASLPAPSSLGPYAAYVAWAVTPDLATWKPLGAIHEGTTTVGPAEMNKFLLVITAEPTATPTAHSGPTVLHGTSPSGWLQTFLTHPMFRGVTG